MTSKLDPFTATILTNLNAGISINQLASNHGVARSTMQAFVHNLNLPRPDLDPEGKAEIPVIHRDYRHLESLRMYPIGDLHIGSPEHNDEKLNDWIAYIEDGDDRCVLNTGDNINAAIVGSKSDVYAETLTVEQALAQVEATFSPLAVAGRLDALGEGNHEARIYRATGINPMAIVANHLGVDHWDGSAIIKYMVGSETYICYVRHGTGNAPASMSAITKSGLVAVADLYVTAHTHRPVCVLEDIFTIKGKKVVRKPRRFVTSGSFVGYERYAAERGYAPSHLGAPRIFFDGTRHDFHVSM